MVPGQVVPARRAGPAAARVGLWLAAFAGLFAMHGLSDHGVATHQMSVTAAAHDHASMVAPARPDQAAASVVPAPAGPVHGGPMELCLAVIGRALALGLGARLLRAGAAETLRVPARSGGLRARARAPDPPDLRRLCIQRC